MKDILAFPVQDAYSVSTDRGMTLRDYFAAKAMQAFLDQVGWKSDQKWFDEIAEGAYRQADAMLKARNK
jgi:hypothetical protein